MAARCYYDATNAPDISPAFDAEWDVTSSAVRRILNIVKGSTSLTTQQIQEGTATTADQDHLAVQFISASLPAQTIAGTLIGRMMTQEEGSAANFRAQMIVRVVSADGTTVTGTIYAGDTSTLTGNPTSEFPVSVLQNRQMPRGSSGITLSSLAINANDRLVVEVGLRAHNTQNNDFWGRFRIGESGASDFPQDESTLTDLTPWLQFSALRLTPPRGSFAWVM